MKQFSLRLLVILIQATQLSAISTVYNFRIAQITKQEIFEAERIRHYSVILLPFDTYQKKYVGDVAQNFAGGLGSFIYNFHAYYFRVDGAFAHITEITRGATTFSGTESDDLLFTIGKNFHPSDRSKVTLSGLFGIPTHKIFELQHVAFGYGQVSAGIQLDGAYKLGQDSDFLYGARYIHFVPGQAQASNCQNYLYSIGSVGDILFAVKHNWPKHHGIEVGLTQRWDFDAKIFPALDAIRAKTEYTRTNFYFVYKYSFKRPSADHRFLFNIAYGFDEKPKLYGNKLILTLWAAWDVRFD